MRNDGVIQGNLAKIQLGAADTFGVDLYGDGLISLAVGSGTTSRTLKAENNGSLITAGGKVLMTAAAASGVVNSVINNTGVIQATSLVNHNGQIVLTGPGATTNVSGTLQAKGGNIETSGNVVNVAADADIEAANWLIDPNNVDITSGTNAITGTGTNPETFSSTTNSGTGTSILNVGTLDTALSANTNVTVQTSGANGTGTLSGAVGNITVDAAINIAPQGSNTNSATLTLDTSGTSGGAVTINQSISASSQGSHVDTLGLIVNSAGNVNVNAAVTTNGNAAVSLTSNNGQVISNSSGAITTLGGNVSITAANGISISSAINAGSGTVAATTTSGNITLASGGSITSTSSSTSAIKLVAAGNFINDSTSTALSDSSGKWLVYSTNPTLNTLGGLVYNFKQYNATTASTILGTGDGFLYTVAPTLTVSLTGTASKVYDGTTTATLAAANYTVSGALDSDTITYTKPTSGTYSDKNVGTSKAVSASTSLTSASNGTASVFGYQLSSTTASGNIGTITAKALAVTATGVSRTYDGTTTDAATLGTLTGGIIVGDTVTDSYTSATFANKNVGTNKTVTVSGISLGGAQGGNYSVNSSTTATASITAKSLSATATGVSRNYDGTTTDTVNLNLQGVVANDTVTDAYTSALFADKNVGASKTVNVSGISIGGADSGNYSLGNTTAITSAAIGPAVLTYTANTASRVYGSSNPTFTGSVSGFVTGDTLANATTGSSVFTTTATASSPVASYAINGSGLTANNSNYTFTQAAGNATALTITPAALTITATGASKIYGTTYTLGSDGFTSSGLVNSDSISSVTQSSTGAVSTAIKGTYSIVDSLAIGTGLSNYTISYVNGTLTITPAALTITAKDATKIYGTTYTINSDGFTSSGLLNSDTITGVTQTSAGAAPTANVSHYDIVDSLATGTGLSNYTISYVNGTLAVTPATLTVSLIGTVEKTYDNTTVATLVPGNYTMTGVVNGDTVAHGDPLTGTYDTGNVGTGKIVTMTGIALSNNALGNYVLASSTVSGAVGQIDQATVTITAQTGTKVYDGTALSNVKPLYTGLQAGDTLVVQENYNSKDVNAATTLNVGYGITNMIDYNVITVPAPGTITPATLTYTANTASSVYGAALPGLTGTVTGFISGENQGNAVTGALAFTTPATSSSPVASYAVNGSGLTANNGNYTFVQNASNATALTITPATLTYVADAAQSSTYGTVPVGLTGSVTGFVLSDNLNNAVTGTLAFTTPATASSNTGSYAVNGSGLAAANYIFTQAATNATALTITPATLTASLVGTVDKTYDGTIVATLSGANYLLAGVVNNDSVTLNNPANGAYDTKDAGIGKIVTVSGAALNGNGLGNYVLASDTISGAVGHITPAPLTINAVSDSKTYDGSGISSGLPTIGALFSNDNAVAAQVFASKDVLGAGGSTLVIAGYIVSDGNGGKDYTVTTVTDEGTITPTSLTISAITDTKVYNGTTASSQTPTITGLLGDTASAIQSFGSKDVLGAGGSTLSVASYTVNDGNGGKDYVVDSTGNAAGTITPAPLSISAVSDSKVYNGTQVSSGTPVAPGLFGTDSLTATQSFDTKDVTATTLSVNPGYTVHDGVGGADYTVTLNTATGSITPAPLTISAVTDTKVYDGTQASSGTPLGAGLFGTDSITAAQSFNSKDVTATTLSVNSGYTVHDGVGGADYTVTLATAAGTITPAPLTITATTDSKTYDGTTFSAQTPTYSGLQSGDSLTLLSQAFASKDVNGTNGSTLNVAANYSLTDSIDYLVSLTPASGTITPKALTVSATGINKVYDTTTGATVTLADNAFSGDHVSETYGTANFIDKNVGTAKEVDVAGITISGVDAGNYTFNTTATTSANIAPASLAVTATGVDKVYDTTTNAAVTLANNALGNDVVTADYTAASFADKNVGTAKPVSVSGINLSGADAGNYTFNTTATTAANITPASPDRHRDRRQ